MWKWQHADRADVLIAVAVGGLEEKEGLTNDHFIMTAGGSKAASCLGDAGEAEIIVSGRNTRDKHSLLLIRLHPCLFPLWSGSSHPADHWELKVERMSKTRTFQLLSGFATIGLRFCSYNSSSFIFLSLLWDLFLCSFSGRFLPLPGFLHGLRNSEKFQKTMKKEIQFS